MNIYTVEFFANCPNNRARIKYSLEIQTGEVIPVEQIVAKVEGIDEAYHEELADELLTSFGGQQVLQAFHHGVQIKTLRPMVAHWQRGEPV